MKKLKWLGAGVALLLAGCATVEEASYTVTSFAEIPLKTQSKLKIVANGKGMDAIASALQAEFAKSGAYKVVEEDADYWFVLNGDSEYAKGEPTKKVSVAKQENERGGQEVFVESTVNLASAVKSVSVAVYEAKTLAPVHYFEVPIYSGDNTKGAIRGGDVYEAAFAKEVVERVKDAFITQQKPITTMVPTVADERLREAFAKGDYTSFLSIYKTLGTIDLAKLCGQIRTKTYEGSDADARLSNYFLYLLVKESRTQDPEALKQIKAEQLLILETSEQKGLAECIPIALARLEYKLANLGD